MSSAADAAVPPAAEQLPQLLRATTRGLEEEREKEGARRQQEQLAARVAEYDEALAELRERVDRTRQTTLQKEGLQVPEVDFSLLDSASKFVQDHWWVPRRGAGRPASAFELLRRLLAAWLTGVAARRDFAISLAAAQMRPLVASSCSVVAWLDAAADVKPGRQPIQP